MADLFSSTVGTSTSSPSYTASGLLSNSLLGEAANSRTKTSKDTDSSTTASDKTGGQGATPATGSAGNESSVVTLSQAARAQMEADEAAESLSTTAQDAKAEADSLQAALDELEQAFVRMLKAFGMNDEDAAAGAKAGRAAVEQAMPDTNTAPTNGGEIQAVTTQTLVVEVTEASFTMTQEGEDGSRTSVSASVKSVSISYTETTSITSTSAADSPWKESDPLILDLDGNGLDLKSGETSGQEFDMDGDGTKEQTAWIGGGDAFLAMDRDGDGEITSGLELFGDQHGAKDGFEELAKLDSNADGLIDAQDEAWGSLRLMKADGSTMGLEEAGVTRINLDAIVAMNTRVADAGRLTGTSSFERSDGSTGTVGNVKLDVKV